MRSHGLSEIGNISPNEFQNSVSAHVIQYKQCTKRVLLGGGQDNRFVRVDTNCVTYCAPFMGRITAPDVSVQQAAISWRASGDRQISLNASAERAFANFRDKNVVFTHFCPALTALR